jgi:hypothetical protein
VTFDVSSGEDPAQVWAVTPGGPALVSASTSGGPANGANVTMDVTSDGRYVLFWSEATDLQGGVGDPAGRLYVRDLHAASTTLLPVVPTSDLGGSISADGQRIAFIGAATVGGQVTDVAAVFDRPAGTTATLLPTSTAADELATGPVEISANGLPVIWNRAGDATTGPVTERADFVG